MIKPSDEDFIGRDSCTTDGVSEHPHRELRLSGVSGWVATRLSQHTVSLGISPLYLTDWDTADTFR